MVHPPVSLSEDTVASYVNVLKRCVFVLVVCGIKKIIGIECQF